MVSSMNICEMRKLKGRRFRKSKELTTTSFRCREKTTERVSECRTIEWANGEAKESAAGRVEDAAWDQGKASLSHRRRARERTSRF